MGERQRRKLNNNKNTHSRKFGMEETKKKKERNFLIELGEFNTQLLFVLIA